jgi:hypothetical protein
LPIGTAKSVFDGAILRSRALIMLAADLLQDGHIDEEQQFEIIEVGFLNAIISWEELLRSCCVAYMLGAADVKGNAPVRFVRPRDAAHAEEIVNSGREFFEWLSAEAVRGVAKRYFDGGWHLLTALDSPVVSQMRLIRNRIAHRSPSSEDRFQDVVRAIHGATPSPPWLPGQFLLERKHRNQPRYYKTLLRQLEARAAVLVNA